MHTYIGQCTLLWIMVTTVTLMNFVLKIFKVVFPTNGLELSLYDGVFSY